MLKRHEISPIFGALVFLILIACHSQAEAYDKGYVCMDERNRATCLYGDEIIKTLYGKKIIKKTLGWNIRGRVYVNTAFSRVLHTEYGKNVAIFIFEEFTADSYNKRPDCHACRPEKMTIAAYEGRDKNWELLSYTKGLEGIGAWGELQVSQTRLHVAGSDHYLLEIHWGYSGQGVTEQSSTFLATFEPNGKPSSAIRELGAIKTSTSSCASGFEGSYDQDHQTVILFKPETYPDIAIYRTTKNCESKYFKESQEPDIYEYDNKKRYYVSKSGEQGR